MKRFLDLSQVPTAELREIRNVLKFGAKAYASKAGDLARELRAENAQLKKVNERRDVVESAGLDWDSDYWMSLDDKTFEFVLDKMTQVRTEVAIASTTHSIKIPPIISQRELSVLDTVRQGFTERKNGSGRRGLEDG